MVWITPTERILLEEEVDEEDEHEGGSGRGEGATKKEDVGREWDDMTNLGRTKIPAQIDRSRSGIKA